MAVEKQRPPTRDEFISTVRNGRKLVDAIFGGWYPFLAAAGLESLRKERITNEVFVRDIDRHLDDKPKPIAPAKAWPRIAVLGDMHEPFALDNLKADFVSFVKREQPEWVVQVGDCFDMYSQAKFPRSHNVFTPKEEENLARRRIEEFWSLTQKAAPKAKCVQLVGNHDLRPLKRVLEALPSIEHWAEKYFADLMSFDRVKTILDHREVFMIADIGFHHGYKGKLGDHRDDLQRNMVVGHTHRMGVVYRPLYDRLIFEANPGFIGDPAAKGLTYTPTKVTGWTPGWLDIQPDGPKPVPWRK